MHVAFIHCFCYMVYNILIGSLGQGICESERLKDQGEIVTSVATNHSDTIAIETVLGIHGDGRRSITLFRYMKTVVPIIPFYFQLHHTDHSI